MVSVDGAMAHERKARIWQIWRQGRPMSEIARDIQKPSATDYSYLLYHGGITPRPRVRRRDRLLREEREVISRGLARDQSIRSIVRELGRAPSTVSREILRNGGGDKYRAGTAEEAFLKRSKRPKTWLLAEVPSYVVLSRHSWSGRWGSVQKISGDLFALCRIHSAYRNHAAQDAVAVRLLRVGQPCCTNQQFNGCAAVEILPTCRRPAWRKGNRRLQTPTKAP